jgi:ribonuclease E
VAAQGSAPEHSPVVTAVAESSAASTVEVSSPAPQQARAEERVETRIEPREEPRVQPIAQAFVAEAAVEAGRPAPVAPVPAAAPKVDAKELLSSSGLVMIETDPSRSKSYQLEEAPVHLGRPRKERTKQTAPEELMQVETKS